MTQAASRYERIEGDRYYTPAWVTKALLSAERFSNADGIWDPAAGNGGILSALPEGMAANGSDIAPDAPGIQPIDFFDVRTAWWRNIVTNPPYGQGGRLAVEFIVHALELTASQQGKVAMLLRADFDSAKTRHHIFGGHAAFAAKYVLTERIRWSNLPQSNAGPTENHAWYVWDWGRRPGTPITLAYLYGHGERADA